jgi:hypothetical protein
MFAGYDFDVIQRSLPYLLQGGHGLHADADGDRGERAASSSARCSR